MWLKKLLLTALFAALGASAAAQVDYGIMRPYVEVKVRSSRFQVNEGAQGFGDFTWGLDNAHAQETDVTVFITPEIAVEWSTLSSTHTLALSDPWGNSDKLGAIEMQTQNLVFQLHYPTDNLFKPYFGVGVSKNRIGNSFSAPVQSWLYGIDFKGRGDSYGWVAQVGLDLLMRWHLVFNVDLKYVWNRTLLQSVRNSGPYAGRKTNYDLTINPVIIGFGVGLRW